MEDEEREVYGQQIPVDGEGVDMAAGDDATKLQGLDEMKRQLKEMEEEAAALREMQAKVAKEDASSQSLIIESSSSSYSP